MRGCAIAAALLSGFIPESSPGTHKAQASTELNQIRSAKRSSLGSAFRARKRDSAATFPITLPYGVRRVIRPASRISSIYVQPKYADVRAQRKKERHGGSDEALTPALSKAGRDIPAPRWCVYPKYIIRTQHLGITRRNEALGIMQT